MNYKKHLKWIIPVALVVIVIMWAVGAYNGMVTLDEGVQGKWADVETQYQRRADLIPNLVSTVKGYAAHESETLESVVKARSEASSVKVDPENLTPEKLTEYQKAQSGYSGEISRPEGKPELHGAAVAVRGNREPHQCGTPRLQ